MCSDVFNGHVGRRVDGLYGGLGVGQRDMYGRMLKELCVRQMRDLVRMKLVW